jgi:hypothetical protein
MNPDLKKKLLAYAKDAHFFQLEERNRISAQIGFCLAGLGLIANACIVYLNNPPTTASWIEVPFWILVGGSLICGTVALFFFFHVLGFIIPNEYQILQSPRKIVSVIRELDTRATCDAEHLKLDEEFEQRLTDLYADAAAINECENERRKNLLRQVTRWSIISLIFLFANALPFFYFKFTAPATTQAVEIVKPIKVNYERTAGHQ